MIEYLRKEGEKLSTSRLRNSGHAREPAIFTSVYLSLTAGTFKQMT